MRKIKVTLEDGTEETFLPKHGAPLSFKISSSGEFMVSEARNVLFHFDATLVKRAYLMTPQGNFIIYKRKMALKGKKR